MAHRLTILAKQAGIRGLFAGLGPRMVMTAGLVSGQFLLYGIIKDGTCFTNMKCSIGTDTYSYSTAMGAPPGLEIHKE